MKRILRSLAAVLCLLATLFWAMGAVCAEEAEPVFMLPVGTGTVELYLDWIDDEAWLFLPSFAQFDQLTVSEGELEWWDMEPDEDGLWYVDVILGEEVLEISVMRSANLRTLFLFSDDPVNYGRSFVEDKSTKHQNEAPASLALVSTQGEVQHAQHIEKLRGRGNGTWNEPKCSYQMKLDHRIDLLDTTDPANRAKIWLLLAEAVDQTMLRNQISMDLGRELGLEVMESEYVDLYYDGSYRGTYRLSEKVEVGEGRIDELDYEELLETWNNKLGQRDLDALPAAEALNRYGNAYTYVEGVVDNPTPGSGACVVEMESTERTLSDRCYFTLNSDNDPWLVYALKSPDNAPQHTVAFISEKLQEARNTLSAGGVNPETGRTAAEDFDLDAFARTMLVQELSGNTDGYIFSSSFFVLPAGESRFEPGPLWDFDWAWRFLRVGYYNGADAFKDNSGWMTDFYRVPAYLELARQIYCEELYPLVRNVLLGGEQSDYLKPVEAYAAHIQASVQMNDMLWEPSFDNRFLFADSYEGEISQLIRFVEYRSQLLYDVFSDLRPEDEKHISLWMDVSFTNPDDSLQFFAPPWQPFAAQAVSAVQLSEATEESYARWQMEAVVSAADGRSLDGCTVTLNGTPMTTHLQEDGTLLIRAEYEDLSYRPVDYYGDDVGLIYNYDRYIQRYPEVAEECEYDEEEVLDYFFGDGMYEGHVGNGFFDPKEVVRLQPHVADYLYEDWVNYYWEFLDWGYDAGWMEMTTARFVPEITDKP